jgi:hypothetical protein
MFVARTAYFFLSSLDGCVAAPGAEAEAEAAASAPGAEAGAGAGAGAGMSASPSIEFLQRRRRKG